MHKVVALNVHKGEISVCGKKDKIILPPGCEGILFVFESKKAARDYWGRNVKLTRLEYELRDK